MEEMLDVYDKMGNYVGVKPKSFCHGENPGVYYKPVWIWIINSKGEILLQKRSSTKKIFPNRWDHAVCGHVKSGESAIDACVREVNEELGLKFDKKQFVFIGEFLEQIYWHIGQIYFLKADIDISKLKLQKEEVDQVKWVDINGLKEILFSEQFGPFLDEYKHWIFEKIKKEVNGES